MIWVNKVRMDKVSYGRLGGEENFLKKKFYR